MFRNPIRRSCYLLPEWRTCIFLFFLPVLAVAGEVLPVTHPFMLWTKEEAAAIRKRIETDATAMKQYKSMVQIQQGRSILNLFKYAVLGDKAAGEVEKKALLAFVGARPPDGDNAPYRDDRTIEGLRYDVLYEELTDEQRKAVRTTFDNYREFLRTRFGPWKRCPATNKPRTGWLPNMQYPTVAGIHVLAVASMDEDFIKEVFETVGCFKWWMDVYVADGGFYMEEFGKFGSPVWSQVLWCEGVERLGLSKYGYGYTAQPLGKPGFGGGGTMRNYLGSLIRACYPRIDRGGNMPDYPCVSMGDAGGQNVVAGFNVDGSGGLPWWAAPRMWGQPKMQHPMWWEYGCRRFPEDGYGYFLAQMRKPGEEVYLPSLICGLGPIDSRNVRPPAAKSVIAPERGFALLRAEEGPAYWESSKPAVGLQFGMYYVHYVHDCFSILQYVADNRFVYNKMGAVRSNYAGGDAVRDSVRGQGGGVTVDSLQISWVDTGDEGCRNQRIRHRLTSAAKFVAVRAAPFTTEVKNEDGSTQKVSKALYPGVDAERLLVLTDEYLFDVFRLTSDKDRIYDWHVQGAGQTHNAGNAPWRDSADLADGKFWDPKLSAGKQLPDPSNVRKNEIGDAGWVEALVQGGERDDTVGVRVAMLPEKGTSLFTFALPGVDPTKNATLMVRRTAPSTVFVALHEPFKGGLEGYQVARFDRLAQSQDGLAVAVVGKAGTGIDDRILLRYGEGVDASLTLDGGNGETFTFSDAAYVRIGENQVVADGAITAMELRVKGSPGLVLNGKPAGVTVRDGFLVYP